MWDKIVDKLFEFLTSITDNDTLIIIFLFIMSLAIDDVEIRKAVAFGMIGYIGKGFKDKITGGG